MVAKPLAGGGAFGDRCRCVHIAVLTLPAGQLDRRANLHLRMLSCRLHIDVSVGGPANLATVSVDKAETTVLQLIVEFVR